MFIFTVTFLIMGHTELWIAYETDIGMYLAKSCSTEWLLSMQLD